MKLLIAIPTLTAFYNYPTYFLLGAIALLFILQVISEVIKPVSTNHYEQVKEVFTLLPNKIVCVPTDLNAYSYNDLSTQVRLMGLKPVNRKRHSLIESLKAFTN